METLTHTPNFTQKIEKHDFSKFKWKLKANGMYKLNDTNPNQGIPHPPRKLTLEDIPENNPSNTNPSDTPKFHIIDNTEKYKTDMTVMTEWGVGKILSINPETSIAMVKIEGSEVEFPLLSLNTAITIYFCVLSAGSDCWCEMKVSFDYTSQDLKSKLSAYLKCHSSQIVLIHNGMKIQKSDNIFELGVYERDVFLAVVKDTQELYINRSKGIKTTASLSQFNAVRVSVNEDIILSAVGLYKNNYQDVYYQLLIFEEDKRRGLKLVYSEKKIPVKCDDVKEDPMYKHRISNFEIKSSVKYQIHQYLSSVDGNQISGSDCHEKVKEENSGIMFRFENCSIQGRVNSSDVEQGMMPMIYFYVKEQ